MEHCETCDSLMDTDCMGNPRCEECDGPCPHCYDGPSYMDTDHDPDYDDDQDIAAIEAWREDMAEQENEAA